MSEAAGAGEFAADDPEFGDEIKQRGITLCHAPENCQLEVIQVEGVPVASPTQSIESAAETSIAALCATPSTSPTALPHTAPAS